MSIEIILGFLASIVGGLLVAITNQLFIRRKTEAEASKLEAEAENIRVETQKLLAGFGKLSTTVEEAVYYRPSDVDETILYDGRRGLDPFDFKGVQGQTEKGGDVGYGDLSFKEGALVVDRSNTSGRYEIHLRKYVYEGQVKEFIPKNKLIAGKRKLRVSCEAKVTHGSHTLWFVIKECSKGSWLDHGKVTINQNEWTRTDLYLKVPPTEECWLRIDDQEISEPSSLQLRNLVLAERSE